MGTEYRAEVSVSDDVNNRYTIPSNTVTVIALGNSLPTGAPVIAGVVTELGVATSNSGTIADADGITGPPGSQFSVQWLLNGTAVSGATGCLLYTSPSPRDS